MPDENTNQLTPETFVFPEVETIDTPPHPGLVAIANKAGVMTAKTHYGVETPLDGTGGGSSLPVADTTAVVKGSADATKLLRFEVDGFTTATTRVATPPDEDFTMVGVATTQTLANKIMSQLHLLIGGFKAIFTHAFTADRTVTLPGDANVTLVGEATAQTLTNKTIDADGTGNVITNIGSSEVKAELITGLSADATPDSAADYVMTYDASATALKKVLLEDLPSGGITKSVTTGTYTPGGTYATNSTSMTDVDNVNVAPTHTTNGSGVTVVVFTFRTNKLTAGNGFYRVTNGTVHSIEIPQRFVTNNDQTTTCYAVFDGLSAGVQTFKLQYRSSDANNVQIIANLPITWNIFEIS
jgi:hypothetical protein